MIHRLPKRSCGSATWLLEMATEFPEVEFYGIDISPIFPREIKPPNTHFSIVDVVQGLPFPDDYFSFAQQRMFMPALRTSEWPSVMADIFRVVKPGGWIQLLEADPNIHNVPEEKMDFWNKFLEYRASVNEDHSTFRRLAKHLKRAGFQSVQRRYMSVPVGWNGPIGDLMRDVYLGYLLAYMPRSAAGMGLTEAEFERLTREYISCCTEVEAYLNFHVLTGQKPEVEEANARA
ncbi:S-adenosyl-L-methionine-dependent methyltransferase [Jimgerdemannia flammicorona]|uniref:S-adenosyl-L-methionine-dependent methyltransferase n=2 Tax=Jimgerdemannia flammicorona TaxID=994334 RepID=A0A433BCC8_9FUNG|nr:S-adenosyl-L-methionine-dependent methyltransferase [Jimgerdemannia flammicorona]RUS18084.1 S-adenosyl-L-methionine-dependent methyltransferase [Jimgerdemannia flammicorona]